MNNQNYLGKPDSNGVYFSVTTMMIDDNRTLGRPVTDDDGYYLDVPVAVLGTVTRNKTQYDVPAFIEQLKGPSVFATRIQEGVCAGEFGHPLVDDTQAGMARLLSIEPSQICNHIRSVSVKHIPDLGLDMVLQDTKPSGPYGKYFEESMEDPTRNTAFSLRGLSKAHVDRSTGIIFKKLVSLTTFDSCVVGSGFKQSTKRYMAAAKEELKLGPKEDITCESVDIINHQLSIDDVIAIRSTSLESFTDTEINDIIKARRVIIGTTEIGFIDHQTKTMIYSDSGQRRNLFRSFTKSRR
jgi:hypothetical protein